jgi:DNA adenine methylase
MDNDKLQKPFLKWVGGKTQIITSIIDHIPVNIENYHEIFIGGGSVLLAVLSMQKQKRITINGTIYASDINESLINVYKNIQTNKDELFKHIETYINTYDSIIGNVINRKPTSIEQAKTSKESYYYWVRTLYNKNDINNIERSAMFMFLNKTCFRGMYREGPNGFNVPYGHYKKTPTIISKTDLDIISDLIKDVVFCACSFDKSIIKTNLGDFIYLDPPYAPETSKSFVGYTADGFDLNSHKKLFQSIIDISKNNVKFVMSNAKVDIVTDTFKEFNYVDIIARRAINSKNPGSTTTEVIIYN